LGEEEIKNGLLPLRDMRAKDQWQVPLAAAAAAVLKQLRQG